MPEYLTPGVYVEETSFRSKSIEGVPTSTFGMAGLTRYGPLPYALPDTPPVPVRPVLVTSYSEFERAFGDLSSPSDDGKANYLAHAARAFFANGGRRLYVARVFPWARDDQSGEIDMAQVDAAFARRAVTAPGAAGAGAPVAMPTWRARWPGSAGRRIRVAVARRLSRDRIVVDPVLGRARLVGVSELAAVVVLPRGTVPKRGEPIDPATVFVARRGADRVLGLDDGHGGVTAIDPQTSGYQLELDVMVASADGRTDTYTQLAPHPDHPRSVSRVLRAVDPADELAQVYLLPGSTEPPPPPAPAPVEPTAGQLAAALLAAGSQGYLTDGTEGNDGVPLAPEDLLGAEPDDEDPARPGTGLNALAELDDIALVATPDVVRMTDVASVKTATDNLIGHCERLRYRMAVVDPPAESSLSQVRAFRAAFDTSYAALYYPWMQIIDPTQRPDPGSAPATLMLPPSGFVAGVYARSDGNRGVHKAPANEVVLGLTKFETAVNSGRQAVLNPEGINALRFFPGRSNRVWGARTMSSDPEWRYVNVRRLFIYLEHSIDHSTQWAVFEPNNERLWRDLRQTIEDFLLVVWRTGALMGGKPEEAFFVRCDRSTMSQNDLDNGRLICEIGVAPTYPAEFVIFRIGQWTADARRP
ncbi:phage tail sheath family protein [Streptomyces kanamyceticus]|uniref:Phage tail sheath family protein n=1 Tax=Streptomyces kanamyceticus TaxID=1967 RepID=A0A5J6GQF0_STRKN|nr:phage tail sheath subtilisin-like domain-containing protein [Streptomyces kanamyceticus]QEU96642.1 phage tail sheath family protein [Streptomyces kanamyceticus]